ncbi:uncharacterized protein C19orf44 homolog isoform X2 [Rhinoderma darwinii]|uniref:uncharacterized protein C19orf44 homolog isoform X2 n=1 Tax=Rhinoderma darwinii TaxID=43563 RepID=UPI003F680C25
MARSGMRNSALARAQAQLAGQRVPAKPKDAADELQEYMRALNKKTSALKLSQTSVAELNDLSAEEQESEKYRITASPQQVSGTQNRFLKKKTPPSHDAKSNAVVTIEAKKPVHPQPVQSKMPTSAALRRLAEIENRHRLRKLEIDFSENDSDLRTSEERPFSNRSSSEFSTREKRFSKQKVNIVEPEPARQRNGHSVGNKTAKSKPGTMESEEEEMLHLVGSSVELSENDERWWKLPKPPRTPSPPSKSTPRRKLHHSPAAIGFASPRRPPSRLPSRTPSPPSYGSPRFPRRTRSLTRFRSRSPSPSVRSSLNSPSPRTKLGRRTPVSQRSDIKSLDELFSRPEDLSSASSNDFKLNILSLDELVLPVDTEEPKVKISKKLKDLSSGQEQGHSPRMDAKSFRRQSISEEESVLEAHTETSKDSEILTHRHKEDSRFSEHYIPEASDISTIHSGYSEDFEESMHTATEHSLKSDSYSYSRSISPKNSILSSNHSYTPNKARAWKKKAVKIQRVTVKEIAVQTSDAGFTYHWPHASIGVEHTAVPFMDPVSMVSHVVSPDLIEALTTYNPMALALNDMLKRQLFLTRSFVDMAQQLYLSTVTSLENESYCYTTLENTKEYIQKQRTLK